MSPLGYQERNGALLDADCLALTVPGIDDGVVDYDKQHFSDRIQQRRQIAARQIRPPEWARKQRIADEQRALRVAVTANCQTHPTGTMSRRVMDPRAVASKTPRAGTVIEKIDRRLALGLKPEQLSLLDNAVIEEQVVPVQPHRSTECLLCRADAVGGVDVSVRHEDVSNAERVAFGGREQLGDFVAGVEDDRLPSVLTPNDEA